jgi:hypothetical protein
MRTIVLLLVIVCLAGCKKNQDLPTRETSGNIVKTTQFSVTTDSLKFCIPVDQISGVLEIKAKGTLTTSLSPEYSSYVVLMVGDTVIWYSSFMEPTIEFTTKDLSKFITGSCVECTLEFHNVSNVHGPFQCSGSIVFSK